MSAIIQQKLAQSVWISFWDGFQQTLDFINLYMSSGKAKIFVIILMRVKMEMENSQLARKVRMLKRIPGHICSAIWVQWAGCLRSFQSLLTSWVVAAGLWCRREKTGFELNRQLLELAHHHNASLALYAVLLLFCRLSFCEPSQIMVDSWWGTVSLILSQVGGQAGGSGGF